MTVPSRHARADLGDCQIIDAKEARKRAKVKARSMHSRVFYSQNNDPEALSKHSRVSTPRGPCASSRDAFTARKWKMFQRNEFAMSNRSCSSISELEPLVFNDSDSFGSLSSISFLNSSYESSRSLCSIHAPIAQGPALFEANAQEKKSISAPRMPKRYSDTLRQPNYDRDSDRSLSLEDIATNPKQLSAITDIVTENYTQLGIQESSKGSKK